MMPTLKAEFKKLLTVRSTYILMAAFLLLAAFFAFYVHGFKGSGTDALIGASPLDHARASLFVADSINQIASTLSVAGAIVALLLLAHEYRYNTIIYTLTASNSRSKILAAKILAVLSVVFVYSVLATAILLPLIWLGASVAGHSLSHQNINFLIFFAKVIFYNEAFAMAGLLFIALIRNQVGALVALLIFPNTIEGLLSLLLKKHTVYLPFTALSQVVQSPTVPGAAPAHPSNDNLGSLSPGKGALVFLVYLVISWAVTWYLFLKRDAT